MTSKRTLFRFNDEHEHLREMCRHIRQGLNRGVETKRIRNYVDWFSKKHLVPHLQKEEEFLNKQEKNPRIKRAMANHRRILRLLTCSCEDIKVLNLLEEELEVHIKFEEKIVYREMKENLPPAKDFSHTPECGTTAGNWKDPFWEV